MHSGILCALFLNILGQEKLLFIYKYLHIYIPLFFLLRILEYGTGGMWVGKPGGAQIKLNKFALKTERMRAMIRNWKDLQTMPGKEQEKRT